MKGHDNEGKLTLLKNYLENIIAEMRVIVTEVVQLLDGMMPYALCEESKVFFAKMKGDYYRYKAEWEHVVAVRMDAAQKCLEAYQQATDIARQHLKSTHPIRLGLALNFSVFYYEILQEQRIAQKMAKQAFDEAIETLDELSEDSYKDTTLIMQLLRDGNSTHVYPTISDEENEEEEREQ